MPRKGKTIRASSSNADEKDLLRRELGIAIAYSRGKKKFFYDGAAFAEYLKLAPRGPHAADAEFQLLSNSFYQSLATDVAALTAAADATGRFLARYPSFRGIAEVRLYLAVDHRDLSRAYRSSGDAVNARKYERLARSECQRIVQRYPRTDQAEAARQLLAGLR
jgi:outer membrane protein assembly factor BamD (BamD/ComL family)